LHFHISPGSAKSGKNIPEASCPVAQVVGPDVFSIAPEPTRFTLWKTNIAIEICDL